MDKKCFFKVSTNTGVKGIVMDLSRCLSWIKTDAGNLCGDNEKREYTLAPIWLTDEEFKNLPEVDL